MNAALYISARRIALFLSVVTLIIAVGMLASDHLAEVGQAERRATKLLELEDAAREDPTAANAFLEEAERQTAHSLTHNQRQRTAGMVALIAAALFVALVKLNKPAALTAPRVVAETIIGRTTGQAVEDAVNAECAATLPVPPVELSPVDTIVKQIGSAPHQLVPLLHAINHHYHYLPPPALKRLATTTRIPQEQIAGVASFYSQFRSRPRGQHVLQVCRGTACHVAGADRVLAELRRELNIPSGHDTDPAGIATIEAVGCLGCCTLAPVVEVDNKIEGHVSVQALPRLVDWRRREDDLSAGDHETVAATNGRTAAANSAPPVEIRVGLGSCCVAGGSGAVMESLRQEIAGRHLNAVIKPVGCVGICHLTPLVEVVSAGAPPIVATRATPADVREILRGLPTTAVGTQRWRLRLATAWKREERPGNGVETHCHICPANDARLGRFLDPQVRIVTEHSGEMDPTSLDEYRRRDGFVALERCLHQNQPTSIIDAMETSGLRGRGGGGYPTGVKWRQMSQAEGEKFLICNGDEGDPGAFMDRMVMESYPYRVLEGMAIAAYAVGAQRAFLYVRHEYPLAVRRLRQAIDQMTAAGMLGDNIMGTEFSLDVSVVEGAGAFVCGEETALLQSMMGRRGIPQLRPPYPVERGLFDRPTLINNVETFANVPWIIRHGPERFAALGTRTSKGTKVFSLSGKVRRAGLIEIPLGLTIRQVVEEIGGGVAAGKRFKAVQIGGPSGGCVPAELADTPIDYENLQRVGAILGSGGLVVLDDDDCMVDVARYFLEFTQRESCGHCTFCRVGTRKLLDILERICAGHGRQRDLDELESLAQSVSLGSMCGLGKTAPNPVLSTLNYFRDEYQAHLDGHCPAGRCKALIRYEVTKRLHRLHAVRSALPGGSHSPRTVSSTYHRRAMSVRRCDACRGICPEQAITVI